MEEDQVFATDGTLLDLEQLAQTVVTSGSTTTITVQQYAINSGVLKSYVQTITTSGGTVTISKFVGA